MTVNALLLPVSAGRCAICRCRALRVKNNHNQHIKLIDLSPKAVYSRHIRARRVVWNGEGIRILPLRCMISCTIRWPRRFILHIRSRRHLQNRPRCRIPLGRLATVHDAPFFLDEMPAQNFNLFFRWEVVEVHYLGRCCR